MSASAPSQEDNFQQ